MYSYEDRIRAVKLYLKLGKRLAATVRQLGYPTTKSLERWYHAYERCLDLPRERICLRPRYSAEQKKAANLPLNMEGVYVQHLTYLFGRLTQ